MDDQDFIKYLEFEDLGPGIAFERHLERLFEVLGYSIVRTAIVGDFGADLIGERGDERVVIQAKRWSQPLGVRAIQEAASARVHYKCNRAIVVTTSSFTEAARALASSNEVELWDRRRYLQEAKEAAEVVRSGGIAAVPSAEQAFLRALDQFDAAQRAVSETVQIREVDRILDPGLPQTKDALRALLKASRVVSELLLADVRRSTSDELAQLVALLEYWVVEIQKRPDSLQNNRFGIVLQSADGVLAGLRGAITVVFTTGWARLDGDSLSIHRDGQEDIVADISEISRFTRGVYRDPNRLIIGMGRRRWTLKRCRPVDAVDRFADLLANRLGPPTA